MKFTGFKKPKENTINTQNELMQNKLRNRLGASGSLVTIANNYLNYLKIANITLEYLLQVSCVHYVYLEKIKPDDWE